MSRQAVAALLLITGAVALAGHGRSGGREPAAGPVKLSGAGDQASAGFRLQAGISTWKVSHDGRSNFQVSLLSGDGKTTVMPINEIGRFRGTQAVRVAKAGGYLLNVKADGKWAITIEQPRPADAPGKPLEVTGKGPSVTRFVTLPKGVSVFKVRHRGEGVFRVKVLDLEGRVVEQVAAAVGAYGGSKAITIEAGGIYLVNIYADGEWALKAE
jgi:hypothetical protein